MSPQQKIKQHYNVNYPCKERVPRVTAMVSTNLRLWARFHVAAKYYFRRLTQLSYFFRVQPAKYTEYAKLCTVHCHCVDKSLT